MGCYRYIINFDIYFSNNPLILYSVIYILKYFKKLYMKRGEVDFIIDFKELLEKIDLEDVSDIHISSDLPIMVRKNGELINLENLVIKYEILGEYIKDILNDKYEEFVKNGEIDFRYNKIKKGFRCNAYKSNNRYSMCMRVIKNYIPKLCDINPNKVLYDFLQMDNGLILVSGSTGSGKSTTIAAMIEEINNSQRKHIITLEDPIEYEYRENKCRIDQREIGYDSRSYMSAIKSALRQDPDIIVVGEIRDKETMKIVLRAAQTGHLVLSTLHNDSAVNSIYRILNSFDGAEQEEVKLQLSSLLRGIISQRLFPMKYKNSRVAAMEIMICTDSIKNIIREGNYEQINTFIQMGKRYGMQTLEMDLKRLLNNNIISEESYEKWKQNN